MRAWGPFSSVGPWDQVLFCRWQQDQAVGVILLKVHFLPHGEQPALGPAAPAGRCTYAEKSADCLTGVSLYITYYFSLAAFYTAFILIFCHFTNEHSGLISFRMDWLDLLAIQGTLKRLPQHHSSKASILWHSALFIFTLLNNKTSSLSFLATEPQSNFSSSPLSATN